MDVTTLKKAIELDRQINELNKVKELFNPKLEIHEGGCNYNKPFLVVQYRDLNGNPARQTIPLRLSAEFIDILKVEIEKNLNAAVAEFNAL